MSEEIKISLRCKTIGGRFAYKVAEMFGRAHFFLFRDADKSVGFAASVFMLFLRIEVKNA